MAAIQNVSKFIFQKLEQHTNHTNVGLLNGLTGESLYYFYRSELLNEDASYDIAVSKLQQVIEITSNTNTHSTFYNGLAGIGWFICHLNEAEITEIDIEDFLDTSVDTLLYEDMIQFLNMNVYDFFYGASGICFYFLKRYVTTQNPTLKETYKTYITHFLFYMEYNSIADVHGKYWKQHSFPFEDDRVQYQLSAANNVSGLMLVLTEIAKTNDFNPMCLPLLKTSSSWLLHQLETDESIRMDQAYCLWKTGKVLKSDSLQAKAVQFLKQTTDHLSQENSISLSRFVLIYQSISHQTNDTFFTEKATESFQIMKEQLAKEDVKDTSIWKGYAGIGLTDLSLKFNLNTHWEACMLI